MNSDHRPYPSEEEARSNNIAGEAAAMLKEQETYVLPDDIDYASIVEGVLQVTPDIEEEITSADRGETVQMEEFKQMFAKWLD